MDWTDREITAVLQMTKYQTASTPRWWSNVCSVLQHKQLFRAHAEHVFNMHKISNALSQ